jgi:hypothetical protein
MNTMRVKYPRTPHLPWSPGRSEDDIALDSIEHLEHSEDIVVTEKLDGENTTLYHDYLHARVWIQNHIHPEYTPPARLKGGLTRFHPKI